MAFRLYLSASIANGPLNLRLKDHLPADRFTLVLPQEFTPAVPHGELPRAIYERCIEEMELCDAGLLLLDAFGMDCASEAGWFAARKKPLVAVAQSNARFLQHWMVKGNLTGVVCLDPLLYEEVRRDPILRNVPATLAGGLADLADHLERHLTRGTAR